MPLAEIRNSMADVSTGPKFKHFPVRKEKAVVPSPKCSFKFVINIIQNPNSLCYNPERPHLFTMCFESVLFINFNFKISIF